MTQNIMIIEDEPAIRDMLQFVLQSNGFEVQCFEDVSSAEKALKSQLPDLILLDWMLLLVQELKFQLRLQIVTLFYVIYFS